MTTDPTIQPPALHENESEWVIDALLTYEGEVRGYPDPKGTSDRHAEGLRQLRERLVNAHRAAFRTDGSTDTLPSRPLTVRPAPPTVSSPAPPAPEATALDAAWEQASVHEQIDMAAEALTRLTEELADTAGRLISAKGMKRLRQAHRALVATFPAPEPEPTPETPAETASRLLEELVSEVEGYLPADATSDTLSELRVALYTWHGEELARAEAPCPNAAVSRLVADLYSRMTIASRVNLEHGLPPEGRRVLDLMLQEAEAERAAQ